MPSNISQNSFATQVRNLVALHPHGISDISIASRLGKPLNRVRLAARNDQELRTQDPHMFIRQDPNTGHEIYFPRVDRAGYQPPKHPYKPRAKHAKSIRPDQFSLETMKRAMSDGVAPLVINKIPAAATTTPPNPLTWSPAQRALFVEREATQMFQAVQAATEARIEQTSRDLAAAVWSRYNELMGEALSASLG